MSLDKDQISQVEIEIESFGLRGGLKVKGSIKILKGEMLKIDKAGNNYVIWKGARKIIVSNQEMESFLKDIDNLKTLI